MVIDLIKKTNAITNTSPTIAEPLCTITNILPVRLYLDCRKGMEILKNLLLP